MPDRRETLLDAAVAVVGGRGVRALTHRAVDAEAGLPIGSTSNYFRTRDVLLEAVIKHFVERERANWESIALSVNPRTATELAQALGAFARQETGPQRTLTLTRYALLVESAQYPALRVAISAGGQRVNRYFENWLLQIGSSNPDRDLRIVANYLTGRVLHDLAVPDPAFDPTGDIVELLAGLIPAADASSVRPAKRASRSVTYIPTEIG